MARCENHVATLSWSCSTSFSEGITTEAQNTNARSRRQEPCLGEPGRGSDPTGGESARGVAATGNSAAPSVAQPFGRALSPTSRNEGRLCTVRAHSRSVSAALVIPLTHASLSSPRSFRRCWTVSTVESDSSRSAAQRKARASPCCRSVSRGLLRRSLPHRAQRTTSTGSFVTGASVTDLQAGQGRRSGGTPTFTRTNVRHARRSGTTRYGTRLLLTTRPESE